MGTLDAFLQAIDPALHHEVDAAIAARLDALIEAGRGAWPEIALAPPDFAAHLASRLTADAPLAETLARLHAADLWLACGCARAVPAAVRAFEAILERELRLGLAGLELRGAEPEDLAQELRVRLLVGEGARIAAYGGRGPLHAWVRVIAVREALQLRRRLGREVALPDDDGLIGITGDPELERIKTLYRDEVRAAFRAGLAALDERGRNLLREHYLAGLSLEQIGALRGVHRATVARWILRAKDRLHQRTRAHLEAQLRSSRAEVDSLIRLLESQLDVTLARALVQDG
jgi:RNA polymerase sigma-70 factor (ECF subfamily)